MKRKSIMQMTVAVLVSLIPALYAFLFLYAYWDPTSRLSDIPVAVVNEDKGAVIDGQSQNIGDSLTEQLKSNTNVKWVFADQSEADKGMQDERYYAELVIPEDFTSCIATAAEVNKTQGRLLFKSNDKLGTFASSILANISANLETMVSKSITENLVDTLAGKLRELPDSLQSLSNGLSKLDDGTKQLSQGMSTLTQGQTAFDSGLSQLATGLAGAGDGGRTLSETLQMLFGKATLFSSGINDNVNSLRSLSDFSGQYNSGLNALSSNLNRYIGTSSQQLQKSMEIITWLKSYVAEHPESMADPNMQQILSALSSMSGSTGDTTDPAAVAASLTSALNQITQTYQQLNAAVQNLPGAMLTASNGASALTGAIGQVSDGAASLSSGIGTLSQGADSLSEKSQLILSSDQQMLGAVNQLRAGIEQMKASVDGSIQQLKSSSASLAGYGKYAASPVKMETTKIGEAKNTGTAMAPFMISLCLWLGGIMLTIIFTTMDKLKFEELKWTKKTRIDLGLFRFQLISVVQSVCLAFTVLNLLGLRVDNVAQFYGLCILGGVTFITIIQVLVLVFRDFGKLLSIIFMLFQLTAGGGMMSMKLVPPFYQAIHPYMPMTYTINALRDNILSMDTSDFHKNITVLVVTLGAGLVIVALMSWMAHSRRRGEKEVILSTAE